MSVGASAAKPSDAGSSKSVKSTALAEDAVEPHPGPASEPTAAQRLQLPDFASLTTEDIFDLVREYRGAPSNTASAMTVEEWREAWLAEWQRANRAEVAVEEIMAVLRSMRELASVAHNGDPWYAENEGLDAGTIFKQAREALGEPDA